MSTSVILAGQSQFANFTTGDLDSLAATIFTYTNKATTLRQSAVGGSALLKAAAPSSAPTSYWLNKVDSFSPLRLLVDTFPAGCTTMLWWQGETEAAFGVTPEVYVAGMLELQAILAGYAGVAPKDFKIVLCYLGTAQRVYTNGWKVRKAQQMLLAYPGFVEGPECVDLAVEADGIHLTAASRVTAIPRIAQCAAVAIGSAAYGAPYAGSFTRDISLSSGSQTIGLPFTPTRVDFSASLTSTTFTSHGTDSGTAASCDYTDGASGGSRTDASIYIFAASSGNGYKGSVTTFLSKAFTITYTKIGSSGAGTATINYTAYP